MTLFWTGWFTKYTYVTCIEQRHNTTEDTYYYYPSALPAIPSAIDGDSMNDEDAKLSTPGRSNEEQVASKPSGATGNSGTDGSHRYLLLRRRSQYRGHPTLRRSSSWATILRGKNREREATGDTPTERKRTRSTQDPDYDANARSFTDPSTSSVTLPINVPLSLSSVPTEDYDNTIEYDIVADDSVATVEYPTPAVNSDSVAGSPCTLR